MWQKINILGTPNFNVVLEQKIYLHNYPWIKLKNLKLEQRNIKEVEVTQVILVKKELFKKFAAN